MSPDTATHAGGRIGVLLVNLGTPDSTGYWAMRRDLKEVLSDRRGNWGKRLTQRACLQFDYFDRSTRPQGTRLRQDLEQGTRRISAKDHHALSIRQAGRDVRKSRQAHPRRLGDALRQSIDPFAAGSAFRPGLRTDFDRAPLPPIRRSDDSDRV